MQVVYKEMTRDGAKSNLAKWNSIGEIKFVISRLGQGSKRKSTYPKKKTAHSLPYCLLLPAFLMVISFLSINSLIWDDKVVFYYQKYEISIILDLSRPWPRNNSKEMFGIKNKCSKSSRIFHLTCQDLQGSFFFFQDWRSWQENERSLKILARKWKILEDPKKNFEDL